MIYTSNTAASKPVRMSGHPDSHLLGQPSGYHVEITLHDMEDIASKKWIAYNSDGVTLYSHKKAEALALPYSVATDVLKYVAACYRSVFPEALHVSVQLVPAGRVA